MCVAEVMENGGYDSDSYSSQIWEVIGGVKHVEQRGGVVLLVKMECCMAL